MIDLSPYHLILASASPRRAELLQKIGLTFTIARPDIDERIKPGEGKCEYALRNAKEKGERIADQLAKDEKAIVVSADTIVVFEDHLLEKPVDAADAARMLRMLSGQTHFVHTGMCGILCSGTIRKMHAEVYTTQVTFKTLSEDEIADYVATQEPMDKAGAYGAQGVGSYVIKSIHGSYTNVVGLPLAECAEMLRDLHHQMEPWLYQR